MSGEKLRKTVVASGKGARNPIIEKLRKTLERLDAQKAQVDSLLQTALAKPRAKVAVRAWPELEVFSETPSAKARKTVANQYGKAFANKTTERLCQALATVQLFQLEAAGPQPRAIVLEFSPPPAVLEKHVRIRAAVLAGRSEKASPSFLRRIRG